MIKKAIIIIMIISLSFIGGALIGKYKGMQDSENIINKLITERDDQINNIIGNVSKFNNKCNNFDTTEFKLEVSDGN